MKQTIRCSACFFLFSLFLFSNIHFAKVESKDGQCSVQENQSQKAVDSVSRWPVCSNTVTLQKISFVHVADVHAHYNPDQEGSSPMARVRGFYEKTKHENPFTIFTDAGDDYEKGSIAEVLSHGKTTRQIVQAMHYDVRTLGNHDFGWGLQELLAFSHDPTAIVLSSNSTMALPEPKEPSLGTPGWTDYGVLTVGCVRIGFFGLVTKPWNEKDEQYEGLYYPDVPQLKTDFHFVDIAREVIAKHRQEVDLLVMVSHLGIEEDIRIAEQTEGIDLILGGHSHTTMTAPLQIKNTSIVHVGGYAEHIGRVDIDYDFREKRIMANQFVLVPNVEETAPSDLATAVAVAEILAPYHKEITRKFARVDSQHGRKDMARIAARAAVETLGVDAALVGVHTVWREWPSGEMTQQDVLNTFMVEHEPAGQPGFSSLYRLEVTGADLLHARDSLDDFGYWGPSYIDPAGVYTVAAQKPQVFHQQQYFGKQIGISRPKHATEVWKAVVAFGRARSAASLSLDVIFPATDGDNLLAFLSSRREEDKRNGQF